MNEYEGYIIEGDKTFGMKLIKAVGRGSVPSELRGFFTSDYMARKAIDGVLALKKEKSNGEVVLGN